MDFVIVYTAPKVKQLQSIFIENTVELSRRVSLFLLHIKIDKVVTINSRFEGKRPGMVNTHLPLNIMNLVVREVECDTCDGSPRRSETFLSVLAFE